MTTYEEEVEHDGINRALVFVKPHAIPAKQFVRDFLLDHKIKIIKESTKDGVNVGQRIDDHYTSLYEPAVVHNPRDLDITPENKARFQEVFGENWDDVVADDRVVNASRFEKMYDYVDVGKEWDSAKADKLPVAPGTVVGKLHGADEKHEKQHHYVVNGFYLDLRRKFVHQHAEVHFFECEFHESDLSWKEFRKDVIGKTNPSKAAEGSLRNEIYKRWEELGLPEQPTYGDNGVHASAGPVEAFRERLLWSDNQEKDAFTDDAIKNDPMGKAMLDSGIELNTIRDLLNNVHMDIDGNIAPAFDHTEDVNEREGLRRVRTLSKPMSKTFKDI